MSGVEASFRHCPACGRRFRVRLESRKVLDEHDRVIGNFGQRALMGGLITGPLALGKPREEIDEEDIQVNYKCQACGHEWSEVQKYYPSFGKPSHD